MKKINIIYWIFTALFILGMLFSAWNELLGGKQASDFMAHLGYPAYLNPFLGVAKILGVLALLAPRLPRIKEWAYAGFFFDLAGATYTFAATGQDPKAFIFMAVFFILLFGSYLFYHKKLSLNTAK